MDSNPLFADVLMRDALPIDRSRGSCVHKRDHARVGHRHDAYDAPFGETPVDLGGTERLAWVARLAADHCRRSARDVRSTTWRRCAYAREPTEH